MQELDYNPSKKDLTDAKIHHLLAEELKPYKRVSSAFNIRSAIFATFSIYNQNFKFQKTKKKQTSIALKQK